MYTINEIVHNSPAYEEAVVLRYEILRKPLKLQFTQEQLDAEKDNYHLGLYNGEKLIAYLMLEPHADKKVKMKQVVVDAVWQGKGIGTRLVRDAEIFCRKKGFEWIYCHARDTAVPFYKKLEYAQIGDMFQEVTIPHYYFEKKL
ncbi:MAG: GNAT family N-acetyltransferase [Chitinophagales bacterium]|nr:GNAT family N-acetyltransferase [Chitinophagales bacterium]